MNIQVQKAVKDNAQEVTGYLQDLSSWSQDMKAKELADNIPIEEAQNSATSNISTEIPVKSNKTSAKVITKEEPEKKRTHPWDYSSWENYDAERACKEVDGQIKDVELTEDQIIKKKAVLIRLKKVANEKKELGNECIKVKNYIKAIDFYTEGIKLDPTNAVLFANRAQAYLYIGENNKAREDCDKAISLDSTYVKAVFRRAKAFVALGDTAAAKTDLKLTLSLDPKNSEAIGILNGLMAKKTVKKPTKPKIIEDVKTFLASQQSQEQQPSSTKPTRSYAFDSEIRERSVTRFNKRQHQNGGGGDNSGIIKTFPRFINPVKKTEDVRSKVPLIKVPVKIVGRTSKIATVQKSEELTSKSDSPESRVEDKNDPLQLLKAYTIPKTSVQFNKDWKELKNSPRAASALYLKQMSDSNSFEIFKNTSMDPSTFSEILNILYNEFIPREWEFFNQLEGLTYIGRLQILLNFLNDEESQILMELLTQCQKQQVRDKYMELGWMPS